MRFIVHSRMPSVFRRIALIGKLRSADIEASLRELRQFLESRGCEVLPDGESRADLAIVIGGDGTMLTAARDLVQHRVPLGGINQRRLGCMTDIVHDDMRAIVGEFLYRLRADGMIVATPTGSTAYALSAQGPILHPVVPAFTLVPLNPHTLSARPVSISDRSTIEIVLVHALDARAHSVGLALHDLVEGDRLVLKRSADTVRFVHPPGYRYFATLREKLGWSESK